MKKQLSDNYKEVMESPELCKAIKLFYDKLRRKKYIDCEALIPLSSTEAKNVFANRQEFTINVSTKELSSVCKEIQGGVNEANYRSVLYYLLQSLGAKSATAYAQKLYDLLGCIETGDLNEEYTIQGIIICHKEYSIILIDSLDNYLRQIHKPKDGQVQVYRGHSNTLYELLPSLLRKKEYRDNEHKLIREAMVLNYPLIRECRNELQILGVLQHHGLPTRLLDITTNPLIALYFACENKDTKYGEVIVRDVDVKSFVYEDEVRLNLRDDNKGVEVNGREVDKWIYFYPTINGERMRNQKAAFVYFRGDELLPRASERIYLIKDKKKIRQQLMNIGIDEGFVYPDLEHACKAIREKI